MTVLTDVNIRKTTTAEGLGKFAWRLKELAVLAGWTVKGSGDGGALVAYSGVTAALAGPDQGSGGAYDCLQTNIGVMTALTAGDFGVGAWVVLENDGRELLIACSTTMNASHAPYGRIAYAPKGSGGFDGTAAAAATIPGAATDEHWTHGVRATSAGTIILLNGGTGYVHCWANDVAENGALALGLAANTDALATNAFVSVAPIVSGTESTGDGDPAVLVYGTAGPTAFAAWNYGSLAMETFTVTALDDDYYAGNGVVDPSTGKDRVDNIKAKLGTAANEIDKGLLSINGLCWSSMPRVYPEIAQGTISAVARTFCYMKSGYLFPWPDALTAPLP